MPKVVADEIAAIRNLAVYDYLEEADELVHRTLKNGVRAPLAQRCRASRTSLARGGTADSRTDQGGRHLVCGAASSPVRATGPVNGSAVPADEGAWRQLPVAVAGRVLSSRLHRLPSAPGEPRPGPRSGPLPRRGPGAPRRPRDATRSPQVAPGCLGRVRGSAQTRTRSPDRGPAVGRDAPKAGTSWARWGRGMATADTWGRLIQQASPDPGATAVRGRLAYRPPVESVLSGIYANPSGFTKGASYLEAFASPCMSRPSTSTSPSAGGSGAAPARTRRVGVYLI